MTDPAVKSSADVFVSYAREDTAFIDRVVTSLGERGLVVWRDKDGLLPNEPFWDEIVKAIDAAAAVVFVVTPSSAASANCRRELAYAAKQQKRLVPVLLEDVPDGAVPAEIADIHWVLFRPVDGDGGIERLESGIRADWIWLRQHARLLTRTREWESHAREPSRLLRGRELVEAEAWLKQTPAGRERALGLQQEFVAASRRATTRRRASLAMSSLAAFVVLVVAIAYAADYYVAARNNKVVSDIGQSETPESIADAQDNAARAAAVCRYVPFDTAGCLAAYINLGVAERSAGNSEASRQALSHVIDTLSGSGRITDDEATTLAIARWERAVTLIQFAERASNEQERAQRYASASVDMNEAYKWVEQFEEAARPLVAVTRARIWVASGDYDRARRELEPISAFIGPEGRLVLGVANACLGQAQTALQLLEKFRAELPNGAKSPQWQRELPFMTRNMTCKPLERL